MIKTIFVGLGITLMVPATVALCVPTKSPRPEAAASLQEVWLTQSQAQRLLASVDTIINYVQELQEQNKAPRADGAQPCSPGFPGCQLIDLSAITQALCQIQLQLLCICQEQQSALDVIGACTDLSVALPSQVDQSDIDALCLSVVSLLKTVLLELRGIFTELT